MTFKPLGRLYGRSVTSTSETPFSTQAHRHSSSRTLRRRKFLDHAELDRRSRLKTRAQWDPAGLSKGFDKINQTRPLQGVHNPSLTSSLDASLATFAAGKVLHRFQQRSRTGFALRWISWCRQQGLRRPPPSFPRSLR